ncbi:hypothetical protein VB264_22880 [Arcicella aquatica]|uniref:Uncharacterized protein n=1 Tax=Arcicella aquatica TaxID=217141 RepID=A0ABU5QWF4_9BACT|nr:hypothetical protein [Arcicella aquatica]MEA5260661.1 hypothetical protein [Arcicella aquatica]
MNVGNSVRLTCPLDGVPIGTTGVIVVKKVNDLFGTLYGVKFPGKATTIFLPPTCLA